MEFPVGAVVEGTVKSIASYGAFISLPGGKTGLVHISEVSGTYVTDIRRYLQEQQTVKVMVIGNENGRLNLSLKRLEAPRPQPDKVPEAPQTPERIFEEKLKQFMADSGSRISSVKQYADHRTRNRRR